ncbi:hypothetical protein WJ11_01290 [Burkholderia cenocepacia]|nr:hypothetical protein WJ11_01290 [Burkholderia cenocepacia]
MNKIAKRFRLVSAVIGVAATMGIACAPSVANDIGPHDFCPLYVNEWQYGVSDLGMQAAQPSDVRWVVDPVTPDKRAIRVQLRRDEDFSRVVNGAPRAEFTLPKNIVLRTGKEYLIRWRIYLPTDFEFDGRQMEIITQLHQGTRNGPPPIMLTLLGNGYEFSVRGGADTRHGVGLRMCCAAADRGRWVEWTMRYAPDASGRDAVTQLWKDGVHVFDGSGKPNAYPDDDKAYLKFGVYKPEWQKLPSDIERIALYFSDVRVDERSLRTDGTTGSDGVPVYR